jgi:hypothetical protein
MASGKTEIVKAGGRGVPSPAKPASAASKEIFLVRYRQGDSVADALAKAGMTRAQLKHALADDERFHAAHAEVEESLLDELEGVARDLARKRDAATVRWILERRRPLKYGHRQEVEVMHRFQSKEEIQALSDEELDEVCREMGIDVGYEVLDPEG